MDGGIVTHRGLSLIELLIAMALGLTLAAGVVQVYAGNSQAARALEARIRVQETGRLALHFLMQTLREARYPGCVRGWEAANSSPGDALDSDRMAKVVNSQQGDWLPSAGASLESFARVAASDVIWAGDTCAGTARQGTYVYVGKRANDVQNPPALFRRHTSAGRAEELFEGVASMQILYG
ncbi:MAG: PilW family protein, partial [Pseudomonas sp.]